MLQQFYPVKAHNYKYELNKDMNFAAHAIKHPSAVNVKTFTVILIL